MNVSPQEAGRCAPFDNCGEMSMTHNDIDPGTVQCSHSALAGDQFVENSSGCELGVVVKVI